MTRVLVSVLIDLDSTNGTLVNGTFVLPDMPVSLEDGEMIELGLVIARYRENADRHLAT